MKSSSRSLMFRGVLVLTLFLGSSAQVQSATLTERATAIDAPAAGGELTLTAPLQVGRAEIIAAKETRVRTLFAGGIPCGVVFDGPASLRYRVEDRFSLPVAERNVRRASDLSAAREKKVLVISAPLDGAVVWGWGLGEKEGAAAKGGALPEWAAKLLAGRRFPPPSHDLLAAEANGADGVRYALLRAAHDNLLLLIDPRAGEENLYGLAKATDPGTSFRQGIWGTRLASQPIGRAWWDHIPPELVAEHERLEIENPAGEELRIVSRSRLRARRAGTALWRASLVDELYDTNGHRHGVTVRSVRVDGRAAEFLHRDDELLVALGRALAEKETVEVEVNYGGEMALRPEGHSFWVLGTWPWYPRQDLAGELATMEISIDVPEPWTPFASGAQASRLEQQGRRKLTTQLKRPMQFAVVAAGKYRVLEGRQDGVTCRAATYAMLKEKPAHDLIARFFAGRRFFEQLFDEPYPFSDFSIVEINSWGFGQAPPGIIFFTKEFYTAPLEQRIYFQDLNARYLHEIAHGWWGHVLKMNGPEEVWISEAFADYTAALAVWQLLKGRGEAEMREIVQDWVAAANAIRPGASLYLMERLALRDERDVEDYWSLRYAKGPLVLHALRLELQRQKGSAAEGDRYFIAFLRTYLQRFHYGWGTTRGLVETLDQLTGGNWQPWFERYVYGTETPQIPL
jgi:peptidase M1-like protein